MDSQTTNQSRTLELAKALRDVVGADAVITEEEALRPFECDGLTAYRELPLMVVLPVTIDEGSTSHGNLRQAFGPSGYPRGRNRPIRWCTTTVGWRTVESDTHESDPRNQ